MNKTYLYKPAARFDMLDSKYRLLHKLNMLALIAVVLCCAVGLPLNYALRMLGAPVGLYIAYALCGVFLCLIYPYFHEFTHAFAIILIKGKRPEIKFGKLAASCGAPDMMFSKSQYFFVASLPFFFYCVALIPLCVLLPPMYFSLPFMPLCYNVFGSSADIYMICRAMTTPKGSIIIDGGAEVSIYKPV